MTKEESTMLKTQFIELRTTKGMSFESISTELKVAKKTLISWAKELKYEIVPLMDLKLEEMSQRFQFGEIQKTEVMGALHKKLLDELNKRPLEEIPSPKLLDMVLAIQERLPKISEIRTGADVMEFEFSRPEKIFIV